MPVTKTDQSNFMAFLESPQDIEVAQGVIKGLNITNTEVIQGGVKDAIEAFAHGRSPQYLLVDISKSELPVSDLSRLLEVCEPGVSIVAIGIRNDVGLYRDLMGLGVVEYLVSPLFSEIVGRALKNMVFGESKNKGKGLQPKLGQIVAVIGSRGGVGSTFFATNFASILTREKSRRAVVVDLDLHFGTLSLYLNLKPNYGLRDALENPDRLDQVFIERLLTPVGDRFFILSSEEQLDEELKYKVEGVEVLLNYLSKMFHYVIVDVPHYLDGITRTVIRNASTMILLTDSSIGGLRDSGRLIRLFGVEGTGHRVILVMNKVGEAEKIELKSSDFEQALKHKVDHVIPYNSSITMECLNQGKLLGAEQSLLTDAIREIVDDLLGIPKPEEKKGGFINFFKKIKLK